MPGAWNGRDSVHLRAQVPAEGAEQAAGLARGVMDALRSEYGGLEADLALAWAAAAPPAAALEPADAARVLALLLTLPHGVLKYSHAVPGACRTASPPPPAARPRGSSLPRGAAALRCLGAQAAMRCQMRQPIPERGPPWLWGPRYPLCHRSSIGILLACAEPQCLVEALLEQPF